jgi:hypothetical protein
MAEWQPIETAPIEPFNKAKWFSSFSPRLLLWNGYCQIGTYGFTERGKGRWTANGHVLNPTHWMALPDPPDEQAPATTDGAQNG